MTDFSTLSTPCLGCATPVDLLDAVAPTDESPAAYRDASRWCGRCMRYMDDRERFVLLYLPRVRRFCLERLRGVMPDNEDHRQLAEDLAQETLMTALRRFDVWEAPERALWTTARRTIYKRCDAYRIVTRDGFPVTVRYVAAVGPDSVGDEVVADPAEAVVAKVMLHSGLSRLPLANRQAVVAHTALGIPASEAGRMLGRPASTVTTQNRRGLVLLKRAAVEGTVALVMLGVLLVLARILEHLPPYLVAPLPAGLVLQDGASRLRDLLLRLWGVDGVAADEVRPSSDHRHKDR